MYELDHPQYQLSQNVKIIAIIIGNSVFSSLSVKFRDEMVVCLYEGGDVYLLISFFTVKKWVQAKHLWGRSDLSPDPSRCPISRCQWHRKQCPSFTLPAVVL